MKMRRLPILATLIVTAAVATMIGLGLWQLRRADEKAALIAQFATNRKMSTEITFPVLAPVPDAALFRRSRAMCLEPVSWRVTIGRTTKGVVGFRNIAACRTGAEGPGMFVDMGVASDPQFKPIWKGGEVSGVITLDPDQPSLFARMFGHPPPRRAMLIADQPASGLQASAQPSLDDIPNNHFGYALQWFFFAAAAAVIFILALRLKRRTVAPGAAGS